METCLNCDGALEIVADQPYRYRESGLDQVWLTGLTQYRCGKCGEMSVELPCVDELHLLIGRSIVCKRELLTGPEVRFLRKEIGIKSKEMAALLSIEPETYSRWENGRQVLDACHDKSLRMIYVMQASEQRGKVLFGDWMSALRQIATQKAPQESGRMEFSLAEWLNLPDRPIFGNGDDLRDACRREAAPPAP